MAYLHRYQVSASQLNLVRTAPTHHDIQLLAQLLTETEIATEKRTPFDKGQHHQSNSFAAKLAHQMDQSSDRKIQHLKVRQVLKISTHKDNFLTHYQVKVT